MKKAYKAISVLTIVLMIACICTNVFAAITTDSIKSDKNLGEADSAMTNIGSTVLTFVTNGAIILSVVIIAVLGVKYMLGSAEEKSEYKKSLLPYVIGALLVFGAGVIGKMVVNFGQHIAS